VAYRVSVRLRYCGAASPTQPTKRLGRAPTLYATDTAISTAYTFCVRLRYVSVAYRILCTPRITIPPMSFSLVVQTWEGHYLIHIRYVSNSSDTPPPHKYAVPAIAENRVHDLIARHDRRQGDNSTWTEQYHLS
jgi:hypothetical protein